MLMNFASLVLYVTLWRCALFGFMGEDDIHDKYGTHPASEVSPGENFKSIYHRNKIDSHMRF